MSGREEEETLVRLEPIVPSEPSPVEEIETIRLSPLPVGPRVRAGPVFPPPEPPHPPARYSPEELFPETAILALSRVAGRAETPPLPDAFRLDERGLRDVTDQVLYFHAGMVLADAWCKRAAANGDRDTHLARTLGDRDVLRWSDVIGAGPYDRWDRWLSPLHLASEFPAALHRVRLAALTGREWDYVLLEAVAPSLERYLRPVTRVVDSAIELLDAVRHIVGESDRRAKPRVG